MLTSKEIMARTGISRATLNNYIALGILPRPHVGPPTLDDPQARRIGYFEDDVVERILEVKRLKSEGLMMSQIAARFATPTGVETDKEKGAVETEEFEFAPEQSSPQNSPLAVRETKPQGPLFLSIEDFPYPAYMLTTNFQVQWWNDAAGEQIFDRVSGLDGEIETRNIFSLLLNSDRLKETEELFDVISFHMAIAKRRIPREAFSGFDSEFGVGTDRRLTSIYDQTTVLAPAEQPNKGVELKIDSQIHPHQIIVSFYREGTLFTYVPVNEKETMLDLLARRERVIRDLLKNRQPFRTDLAVLAAGLQGEQQLKSEMAPQDYFELTNDIWVRMDPIFRKYYGVHGKHNNNGLLFYFFPQPDCGYAMNAARCALDLQIEIEELSRTWRAHLSWLPMLKFDIGLEQGREWFGSLKSTSQVEFIVLGETNNRAEKLSEFSRNGQILCTKNLIGEIALDDQSKLQFGISRTDTSGRDFFVPNTFSRIRNLENLTSNYDDLPIDLADLAICEITSVQDQATTSERNSRDVKPNQNS